MGEFYMVYLEGGRTPVYKHGSFSNARTEARRLAKEHNKEAFILKAILSIKINEFIETTLTTDDLPF